MEQYKRLGKCVIDLLADQYKAVLPLTSYYQFTDKYFTPCYLLDIVAERE